jgi:prepilin-type N-terminal cleavage/methylation domain-containing protein
MGKIKLRSETGFTLVEVIVAIALLATIGAGLLAALTGATKVLLKADTSETVRDLAQAQMEYIQNQDFSTSYTKSDAIDDKYPGFTSFVTAGPTEDNRRALQKITIDIQQGGSTLFTLEGYKVDIYAQ